MRAEQKHRFQAERMFVALALVVVAFLTGCAGILPVPPLSQKLIAGRVIECREVAFIVPGSTTRPEVEQRLGPSNRYSARANSLAYTWERPGWTVFWWVVAPSGGIGDNFSVGGWHALFVAFDDEGVVLQTNFLSLSDRNSLDDQLERWAKRVRKKACPVR